MNFIITGPQTMNTITLSLYFFEARKLKGNHILSRPLCVYTHCCTVGTFTYMHMQT